MKILSFFKIMVIPMRFERTTHWLKVNCSSIWATESKMAALAGFEPAHVGFKDQCLTTWLQGYLEGWVYDDKHKYHEFPLILLNLTPRESTRGIIVKYKVFSSQFPLARYLVCSFTVSRGFLGARLQSTCCVPSITFVFLSIFHTPHSIISSVLNGLW